MWRHSFTAQPDAQPQVESQSLAQHLAPLQQIDILGRHHLHQPHLLLHPATTAATPSLNCCYTQPQLLLHPATTAATPSHNCCYTQLLLHPASTAATSNHNCCCTQPQLLPCPTQVCMQNCSRTSARVEMYCPSLTQSPSMATIALYSLLALRTCVSCHNSASWPLPADLSSSGSVAALGALFSGLLSVHYSQWAALSALSTILVIYCHCAVLTVTRSA